MCPFPILKPNDHTAYKPCGFQRNDVWNGVIFDRSGQSCRPLQFCFASKADLTLATTGRRRVEVGHKPVIQAPKLGSFEFMRYELTDPEWAAIRPMLPNKPRGVARVNDRRVLNGIFWVLRSGAPWRDLLKSFGPYIT
jgi:Putative transposase of IS4/5 family (DUF4096)